MKIDFAIPELERLIERIKSLESAIESFKPPEPPKQQWYSVTDAAAYLDCSTKTIRRLLKRGVLKRSFGTHKIKIHRDELEQYKNKTTI
jgi:excisionase family DNA binding protein